MSHRRRRISRVLLVGLAVTIGIGVFAYMRRGYPPRTGDSVMAVAATTLPTTQPSDGATPATQSVREAQPQQASAPFRTETPGLGAPPLLATSTPTTLATPSAIAAPPALAAPADGKSKPPSGAAEPATASIKGRPPVSVGATPVGGADVIAQAKSKVHAGKLLEARDLANAPLVAGKLNGADADAARALLSEINQTVVFSTRKFADDRFGGTYQVLGGDRLERIGAKHAVTSDLLMKINGLSDPRRLRAGSYIKVLKGPFHAVVSKSAFRLDLYLGGLPGSSPDATYVTSYPVGLGKDGSTPLGKWRVEPDRKVKNPVYYSPRGEGVIEADDPANPLGEYWIGLGGIEGEAVGKESYGIHGTIDPASIGKMESLGCIRLKNQDIAVVFSALVEGKSTVLVVE
jgi:LysM repeat protein